MSKPEVEDMLLDPLERTLSATERLSRTQAENVLMALCNNGLRPKYPEEAKPAKCQRQ